ncbi:molybdate ABC transporter substrate-binding protein [Jannaschia donghaensis]|uniref:Molybdate-binding periplasmic protein n=1 Tax=Jannaschia donghaensis TaxID=420998 RepID=A0A0M6YMY1_9RHOB|nr:molybdate ABC transporter substrate-binding protein [Jannaschia donghaensis]CTQ50386.1 Molybdate-binding periplasmic protein precursor [Jannaschia donghaensis]
MARPIRFDVTRRGVLAAGLATAVARPSWSADGLTVFAAASLKPALDEIVDGWDVALAYGGSGTLARQVASGAPADVILLAATDWMDWLSGQGALTRPPMTVARNRLVLAAAPDVGAVPLSRAAIVAALGHGRMAMGDPMSVPAGRYAQQALETLGLWEALSDRLILTNDVRAVLAYVARGDVTLGAVYGSDAVGTGVGIAAQFPASSHAPIVYPGAVVSDRPEAVAFLDHVAASAHVFAAHGFAA